MAESGEGTVTVAPSDEAPSGEVALRAGFLTHGRFDAKNVHYVLISDQAELYTWGSGAFGRLGHGKVQDEAQPRAVTALANQRVVWTACGWDTTAAVNARGELYVWGNGISIPRLVPFPGEASVRVAKVCLGESHAAVLSERGDVYTFGAFVHGRKTKRSAQRRQRGQEGWVREPHPRIVYNLPPTKTKNIACGSHHILALTVDGKVYSWGDGSWGKLGHGSETEEWMPRLIEAFENVPILQIDAGDDHSVFLSTDGTVYTCGCPHDGRLGLAEEAMKEHQEEFTENSGAAKKEEAGILAPLEVQGELSERQVVAICAGATFTLCRTPSKDIFWFGKLDFDEALSTSPVPSKMETVEVYPLIAMASRVYSSMTIKLNSDKPMEFTDIKLNEDKKAAGLLQQHKQALQVRHLRTGPRRDSFPEIGQIAKVKGLWDKRGKTLDERDTETLRNAILSHKKRGSQIDDANMRRVDSDAIVQLTPRGDDDMVGGGDTVFSASSHEILIRPATETSDKLVDEEAATGNVSDAEKKSDATSEVHAESKQPSEAVEEVKEVKDDDITSLASKADAEQSEGEDDEDIRGEETPRQKSIAINIEENHKEESATEGEDDEDIRLVSPRDGSATDSLKVDKEDDAHTENEDEMDIRGEDEVTPRKIEHVKQAENDEADDPTDGEDEEDIRGETPGSGRKPKKLFSDEDEEHSLTEGDDEMDIRGEDESKIVPPRATSAEKIVRVENAKQFKESDEMSPRKKNEGGLAAAGAFPKKIMRNISQKLIGRSSTIDRDLKEQAEKEKDIKKAKKNKKKAHTTSGNSVPSVSSETKVDASGNPAWSDSSTKVKTKRLSGLADAPRPWLNAMSASESGRNGSAGRSVLMSSGRLQEDNAEPVSPSSTEEKRKSNGEVQRLQIRESQEMVARRKSREVEAEKRSSREIAGESKRASGGFLDKAIERRSKELRIEDIQQQEKAPATSGSADGVDVSQERPTSSSPFKKFHTLGRMHRKRNQSALATSNTTSDSMDAIPTKPKRFSISAALQPGSPRGRIHLSPEAAQVRKYEKRLKAIKPGETSLEERALILREWAEFLVSQRNLPQQASGKTSPKESAAPSAAASPARKSRFGTLRRKKNAEQKDGKDSSSSTPDEDSSDSDEIAGTIIGGEEILLKLQSGDMIRLTYEDKKSLWVEDMSVSRIGPSVQISPPSSPSTSPRTPNRTRLARVPLFRTHSLSLNFLRGDKKQPHDKIERAADDNIATRIDLKLSQQDMEESFAEVWKREKEQRLKENEEKRKLERKQRKKEKEKEWQRKQQAKDRETEGKEMKLENCDESKNEGEHHSESDYSSSDLKLEHSETPRAYDAHTIEPTEQEA